ncbi:TRAP transporter permease, partial [Candidatus Omnitrophota bacterium]
MLAIIYIFNIRILGKTIIASGYLYLLQSLIMPLVFLVNPARPSHKHRLPWYDIIFSILCFVIPFYLFLNAIEIMIQGWELRAPTVAYIMALVYWPLILEAARRTVGLFFCIFLSVVSIYPLFASIAPGMFKASNLSIHRLASFHLFSGDSIMGLPMNIVGTMFIGFLLFASTLVATGASKAFLDFAMAIFGSVRGGTAKVGVVSSALVASLSGGAVTNIMVTGPITIPAMKRTGYPPYYAAAIEACASTGGVLMPPVMGAAAFLMASFLNIPYFNVMVAALVPISLYYVGLFMQADGFAAKAGIKGIPRSELPPLKRSILQMLPYVAAIVILVILLAYLRRAAQAPFYGIVFLIVATIIRKETRMGLKGFINLFEEAGRLLVQIVPVLAGVGFVLGSLLITGIAPTLSSTLADLAGGNVILLVVMAGIASFILGMGLTVSACYVILAVLVAPSLVKLGLDALAVHLFVLYCAMLSFITPPVAIGSYAAAILAGASFMKVGFQSVRLGAVIFIIPFLFIWNPAFILHGSPLQIILTVVTGLLGVIVLASGLEGYLVGAGRL